MATADASIAVIWFGVTCYTLLAGADFGAGFWDLFAGRGQTGRLRRERVNHSIGPVWEANHVWLIFVIVMMWTAFPPAFAAIASTLFVPLTLVALGVIARGSAFAFRKALEGARPRAIMDGCFAASSVLTPFFLGTVAGALASGRVPPGIAAGSQLGSWCNPTGIYTGVLAVGVCAYLAATYLTADARREGQHALAEHYRRDALVAGASVGVLALVGLLVLRGDAPRLYAGLTGRALALVIASGLCGLVSLVLMYRRAYLAVRVSAALAVAALIWGWGIAQYPRLLPRLDVDAAAANASVLTASLLSLGVGAVLLVPSLVLLYVLFQRDRREPGAVEHRHR